MPLLEAGFVDLLVGLFYLLFFFGPLLATWLIGRWIQARHVASLERRESDIGRRIIVTTEGKAPAELAVTATTATMVSGSVVVGTDYFRRFLAGWRVLFGGRVNSIEPVIMRARREAILRMLEKADQLGANFVINVRIQTSELRLSAGKQQQHAMAEVVAYGTAVRTSFDDSPYGLPAPDNRSN